MLGMALFQATPSFCSMLLLGVLLWSSVVLGSSIPMNYCATVNTASTSANHSIYQSDGLCHDFCKDQFALAIVQEDSCWCSNFLPDNSKQVSTSKCSQPCPGFPDDVCGGPGLYGYMALNLAPSGTLSPGSSSSSSSSTTSQGSVTTGTPTSTGGPSSSSLNSSTSSSTTTSSDQSTPAPTTPTVQTVTTGGIVQTVTVTPTAAVTSPNQATITSGNGGLSTGAAVGIAVTLVVVAVAVVGVLFCLWRRKKQRRTEDPFNTPSPRGSSAGMANSPKVTEIVAPPPFVHRNGEQGNWDSDQSGRRRSTLMPIDPRIDPAYSGIYNRNDNKSHDSINTLRDDQDYSRKVHHPTKVLRATNPDPHLDD